MCDTIVRSPALFLITFLFAVLLQTAATQAVDLQARSMIFCRPGGDTYVELILSVNSRSVHFQKQATGKLQASVRVEWLFYRGDSLIKADRYRLSSQPVDSGQFRDFSFLDLQRYTLPLGSYRILLNVVDWNDTSNHAATEMNIDLMPWPDRPLFSDVIMAERISKSTQTGLLVRSGLEVVPRLTDYFGLPNDTLYFYVELYTSDNAKDSVLLMKATLEGAQGQPTPCCSRFARISPRGIHVLTDVFPLREVPSGNYRLRLELRDSENRLIAEKIVGIQRLNSRIAPDFSKLEEPQTALSFVHSIRSEELPMHVGSVRPICLHTEQAYVDQLLAASPTEQTRPMRTFLHHFWLQRDPGDPAGAWARYAIRVEEVNQMFSTKIMRGFETERGRVYLQYGKPDSRTQVPNEPSAYPYEIWWYYRYKGQRNIRFVFYNPDMITNDYELLHSEALGEPSNPQWRLMLFSRTTAFRDLDEQMNRGHYGSFLEQNFRNQ
ncbi:MAG: GWxTD domain-containing protein [Sphingomonadales bacterium]|nr:GWxTD domain-containing protein [Sphingomonadales bacterium]